MAITDDAPFGFKPLRYRSGAPYNGAVNKYIISATESNDLFKYDLVVRSGTASSTDPNIGVPIVTKITAGAGNYITGAIVGFEPIRTDHTLNFYDASALSSEVIVWVADDPDLIFVCQDDGAGATLAVTDIGEAFDVAADTAGSSITGISGMELDANTAGAGATGQLKLLRMHPIEGNAIGTYAHWQVAINYHSEVPGIAGI